MDNWRAHTGLTKLIALLFALSLFAGQIGIAAQPAFADESDPPATPVIVEPTVEPTAETTPQIEETPTVVPTEVPTAIPTQGQTEVLTEAPIATPTSTAAAASLSSESHSGDVLAFSCDGSLRYIVRDENGIQPFELVLRGYSLDNGPYVQQEFPITTTEQGERQFTFDFAALWAPEGIVPGPNQFYQLLIRYADSWLDSATLYNCGQPTSSTSSVNVLRYNCLGVIEFLYSSPAATTLTLKLTENGTQHAPVTIPVAAGTGRGNYDFAIEWEPTFAGSLVYSIDLGSTPATTQSVDCPTQRQTVMTLNIQSATCDGQVTYSTLGDIYEDDGFYITYRQTGFNWDSDLTRYGTQFVLFRGHGTFSEQINLSSSLSGPISVTSDRGTDLVIDCGAPQNPTPTPIKPDPSAFSLRNVRIECNGNVSFDYVATRVTQIGIYPGHTSVPVLTASIGVGSGTWNGQLGIQDSSAQYELRVPGSVSRFGISGCGTTSGVRTSFVTFADADCSGNVTIHHEGDDGFGDVSLGFWVNSQEVDYQTILLDPAKTDEVFSFATSVPTNYSGLMGYTISARKDGYPATLTLDCPENDLATPTPTVTPTPTPKPAISVTSKDVIPGQNVTIAVTNFDPNATVRLRWKVGSSWTQVGTLVSDSSGAGSATVRVPVNAAAGKNTVRAESATKAQQTSSVTVTIPGPPAVSLSTTRAVIGANVSYSVTNFLPNSQVTATWRRPGGSRVELGVVTTGNSGSASGTFTVPATEGGPGSSITFTDGVRTVKTTFDVAPTLSVSPTSMMRGSTVTVSIKGYGKRETVRIRWYVAGKWVTVATIVTTNTGTAQVTIKVPSNAPIGPNKVRADGTVVRQQTNAVTVTR